MELRRKPFIGNLHGMTLLKGYQPPLRDTTLFYLGHIKKNIIKVPLFLREGFRVSSKGYHIELIPQPLLLKREGV
jgi:hypothetical protein